MNILFISSLSQSLSTGPAWSVPARIAAQGKIDNVYWVNTSSANHRHWIETGVYHNISEFAKVSLNCLPEPFNRPDIVVFEGFYGGISEIKFARECWKYDIPYIIVPRCSLTYQAMHNKSRWKKALAHLVFYDRFVKRASAVQYLTQQEYEDSKYRFNGPHFILPNGFNTPKVAKSEFSKDQIKSIFIGRIDIHQKGLDILLDVIDDIREELLASKFSLILYGPRLKDFDKVEEIIKKKNLSALVSLGGEVLNESKQKAILESDVFLLTSRFEGHPMSLIEALAYGLPCIITTGSNMRSEVEERNCGWCCDFTHDGIKGALLSMVRDSGSLYAKSRNAILLAGNYDWSNLAKEFNSKLTNYVQKK